MTYEVNGNGYILKLYRPNRNFPLPMKKMILGLGESNIFRENKHRKSQNYYEAIPYIFISSSCFGRLQQRRGIFTPPAQEQLTQNAYADNESTGGGFSFTTDAPWTATVNEVQAQASALASVQAKSVTRAIGNSGKTQSG